MSESLLHRATKIHVEKSDEIKKELELEHQVLQWITSVVECKEGLDYAHLIQDGTVLSKLMTNIVYNSVPKEDIGAVWGASPALDRTKALIREIKKYGVKDVFEPEDLLELRDIPKVTKCLSQLAKLAASDPSNVLKK